MRALATAALLSVVLAVSACGSRSGTTSPDTAGCAGRGVTVAKADLDGDGDRKSVV